MPHRDRTSIIMDLHTGVILYSAHICRNLLRSTSFHPDLPQTLLAFGQRQPRVLQQRPKVLGGQCQSGGLIRSVIAILIVRSRRTRSGLDSQIGEHPPRVRSPYRSVPIFRLRCRKAVFRRGRERGRKEVIMRADGRDDSRRFIPIAQAGGCAGPVRYP